MKNTKKVVLCTVLVTVASYVYADVPLQLKSGVMNDFHNLQKHTGEKVNKSPMFNVWYIKYNTHNKNILDPKHGVAYETDGYSTYLTLDPPNETTAQCVTFVKTVTSNYTITSNWIKGAQITSSTPNETIIAKFTGVNNTYDGENGGHVAILHKVYPNGTAHVYDQNYAFDGRLALRIYTANELSAYSVVMRP